MALAISPVELEDTGPGVGLVRQPLVRRVEMLAMQHSLKVGIPVVASHRGFDM